jgi:hypothetical protein
VNGVLGHVEKREIKKHSKPATRKEEKTSQHWDSNLLLTRSVRPP